MKNIFLVIICILFYSCSRYSPDIEAVLKQAGRNRGELEKVLKRYGSDKLKLKAAEFLVKNMSYYQHTTSNAYRSDIEVIKAQYLINNIEWAFKVWREAHWGKRISFEHFCKEILPYRVGSEPPEEWRERYYNYFQPVLDSLLRDDSPVTACQILYDTLVKRSWKFTSKSFADLGANVLLDINEGGHCTTQCQLMTFVMRSVGIPGGIDSYLCAPDRMGGPHAWNYLRNTNGKIIPFEFEPCDMKFLRDTTGRLIKVAFLRNARNRLEYNFYRAVFPTGMEKNRNEFIYTG